jgi:hypothetical protein
MMHGHPPLPVRRMPVGAPPVASRQLLPPPAPEAVSFAPQHVLGGPGWRDKLAADGKKGA